MAAPTTIQDLPDDMLHEIFGHLFADELKQVGIVVYLATEPPKGAHQALRCVCRRWRDIADWVRLSTTTIGVNTSELDDVGAVRPRHPAALKRLALAYAAVGHSTSTSRVAVTLINGSADLRRALVELALHTCCLPEVSPAVTTVQSCTALTTLHLYWGGHEKERVVPFNMLAPLSALRMLKELSYGHTPVKFSLPASALRAPLPALPDAPRLTFLGLNMRGNFVPVGSDAALGRLRKLTLCHLAPLQALVDAEDPFLLRAAADASTWRPSRLTGLQELTVEFHSVGDSSPPLRRPRTRSRAGSEWAALADQVTKLIVKVKSMGYKPSSTGIVAGLGVLTALRELRVKANIDEVHPGWLEPFSPERVRAPNLTALSSDCAFEPINVAQFPNLVYLHVAATSLESPVILRSLVARASLENLHLITRFPLPGLINLAELFVGGGWPVLKELFLKNMVIEWAPTGLVGAPTAAEFAERARQLFPALVRVKIDEPRGRDALPYRSRVEFVVACRRHVVPALLGLHAGPAWNPYERH